MAQQFFISFSLGLVFLILISVHYNMTTYQPFKNVMQYIITSFILATYISALAVIWTN